MNGKFVVYFLVIVLIILLLYKWHELQSAQPAPLPQPTQVTITPTPVLHIGIRTKTTNCQVNGSLQDIACTPGAIDPALTKEVLCSKSFTTKSVRDVSASEKQMVYEEYGITSHGTGEYEVDHLISLELGGSNDIANLWPESATPTPGFHEKDKVENYLHKQVCDGAMSLEQAQQIISTNWLTVYQGIAK